MAMQLTKSKAGSIYLFDKIKTVLRRKVYVGEKKPPEVFKQYREKTNIIQYVFYNSKKLFLSNNLSELSKRYPNIKYYSAFKNSSIRNIKEFAYPLQFKSGEKEIIFGVLNLEKNDGTNFTSQDLRLVEILSEQCGSVFNYFIQNMSLRMIINKIVENLSCEGAPEGSSDMETTKDIIDLVVLNAFKCTPAHSVTVRYVDKDERKLLRFCVKSVFKTDLNKNQLPISLKNYRESCNAWACVNGKECYINNVYKKDEFKKYKELKSSWKVREETIAEFCLPIVVQGRVIGTMNLESIYRAGFDYSIDYLRTLVKLLELSISLNRYKIEETAFKSRTILLYSLHDLKNKIRDLWKKNRFSLKKSNKNNNVFIDNLLDLIDSVESYEMRQDNEKGKEKILSIVSQVIKDLEIENVSIIRENDLFVKTEYITSLKMALNNIFDNCRLAAMGSTIYIKGRQSIFKNKKSLNLLIEHQGTSDLKEEEIDKLYYRPFLRKGKIRLGAFTAGVLLRSIGGNVYMSRHIYESPVIRIIVAIPVE